MSKGDYSSNNNKKLTKIYKNLNNPTNLYYANIKSKNKILRAEFYTVNNFKSELLKKRKILKLNTIPSHTDNT